MIGNQSAIPCYCNRELVISAGWLAGHEVQFKDTAEKQEKNKNYTVCSNKNQPTD